MNADDIESISILKDAAAAIYGLGAANGVVLVKTKRGGKSKPTFNYNTVFSYVKPTDVPAMASAAQYTQMWNDTQLFIPGGSGVPYYDEEEIAKWQDGSEPGYEGTNWDDLVLKKQAITVQHNFSATGGTEKTNYFVSFGHVKEDGLLVSDDMGYKRYNFRSNLTTELAKNLKASILVSGRWDENWQPGTNFFGVFKGTRVTLPTEYAYANNNPNYLAPVTSGLNPLAFMERDITGYSESNTRSFNSTFQLEYDAPFLDGLSFKAVASYDAVNFQNKTVSPTYNLHTYDETDDTYDAIKQRDGTASISNANSNSDALTFQGFITYDTTINEDHVIGATAVIEKNSWAQRNSDIMRWYATFYTKDQLRFADVQDQTSDGIENETADFSYVGRVNYAYKGKYLVRIEDTDLKRSTDEAVQAIHKGLKWLNIVPTEKIIYQSQEIKSHVMVAFELLEKGFAYKCYLNSEELTHLRIKSRENGSPIKSPWREKLNKNNDDSSKHKTVGAITSLSLADLPNEKVLVSRLRLPPGHPLVLEALKSSLIPHLLIL